ncbi:hypothetical protein D3C84_946970 [compost metagenome]
MFGQVEPEHLTFFRICGSFVCGWVPANPQRIQRKCLLKRGEIESPTGHVTGSTLVACTSDESTKSPPQVVGLPNGQNTVVVDSHSPSDGSICADDVNARHCRRVAVMIY